MEPWGTPYNISNKSPNEEPALAFSDLPESLYFLCHDMLSIYMLSSYVICHHMSLYVIIICHHMLSLSIYYYCLKELVL